MLLLWAALLISFVSKGYSQENVKGKPMPKSLECGVVTYGHEFYYNCSNIKIDELNIDSSPKRYTHLYFINCGIRKVGHLAFYVVPNMVHLDLRHNHISSLGNETFSNSTKLQYLDLSYNDLEVLNNSLFETLINLRRLNLSQNGLVRLTNANTFKSQVRLESLDLSGNGLKTLKEAVLKPLRSLETLALQGNALDCDCEFLSVMSWIVNNSLDFKVKCVDKNTNADLSWRDLEHLRCNESNYMKGITNQGLKYSDDKFVYIAVSTTLVILVLVAILSAIWWRRRKTACVSKSEAETHSIYGTASIKPANLDHLYAKVNKNHDKKGIENEGFLEDTIIPQSKSCSTNDSAIYAEVSQPTVENHPQPDFVYEFSGEYASIRNN